jgi:hypothetical protein
MGLWIGVARVSRATPTSQRQAMTAQATRGVRGGILIPPRLKAVVVLGKYEE